MAYDKHAVLGLSVVAQRVYRKHKVKTTRVFGFAAASEPTRQDTIAYLVPAAWIMPELVICVREDVEGDDLLDLIMIISDGPTFTRIDPPSCRTFLSRPWK